MREMKECEICPAEMIREDERERVKCNKQAKIDVILLTIVIILNISGQIFVHKFI